MDSWNLYQLNIPSLVICEFHGTSDARLVILYHSVYLRAVLDLFSPIATWSHHKSSAVEKKRAETSRLWLWIKQDTYLVIHFRSFDLVSPWWQSINTVYRSLVWVSLIYSIALSDRPQNQERILSEVERTWVKTIQPASTYKRDELCFK